MAIFSQTPSDATTSAEPGGKGMPVWTSGSLITPRSCATLSPSARDMASPGNCEPRMQTRRAEIPLMVNVWTSPPEARTRRSASASTTWSTVLWKTRPPAASMRAESPTCATATLPAAASASAIVAVVPENSVSGRPETSAWWAKASSASAKSRTRAARAAPSESGAGSCGTISLARARTASRTRPATRWPHRPWPSKTATSVRELPSGRTREAS
mmetsp:Transcript_141756/g.440725  ORF Transcript_141756/g.440725 Transcript_141756/m.440725 type:complete len:215 (+) Transcript_141756:332-976(+)